MMRLLRRYKTVKVRSEREKYPIPIVGDAAIAASPIGGGRLVPLLILDTTDRSDIEELLRVHEHLPPGDVEYWWGRRPGPSSEARVTLSLDFKRPIETFAMIEFDIVEDAILVDQILTAKLLYLQAGRTGDRFITNPRAHKIIIEVGDTGFRNEWDIMLLKHLIKFMRHRGLARQQARRAAEDAISNMRAIGKLRMP